MKSCYIVGAGSFYGSFCPTEDDFVIAADGGYLTLKEKGIRCDLLVGDLDSLEEIPNGVEILRHPVEKDETDMHLAFLEGASRGFENFEIYGGVGGRADHTFANYCLLSYIRSRGCRATLHDSASYATVIENEAARVVGKPGNQVSVFAFGGEASGVSIKGMKYTLNGATLTPDFPLGVSNELLSESGEVAVERGKLLIIAEK